tara:strand:+ start:7150 stop:7332 length:183 start_codon:yes stop_codon:yes gene_type:complete
LRNIQLRQAAKWAAAGIFGSHEIDNLHMWQNDESSTGNRQKKSLFSGVFADLAFWGQLRA